MDLPNDCIVELKHIKLELENNRFQHFRHFVDQYYCYKNGYIKKTGNPDWEKIVWSSKEAISINAARTHNRKEVVKEHVIPLKRIRMELLKLTSEPSIEIDDIRMCLDKYLYFATITKDEDQLLRDAKLNSTMPFEFDDPDSILYQDVFARYKRVGIELVQQKSS